MNSTSKQTMGDNVGPSAPPLIVVMGVAGCGKTTVGQVLSELLQVPFADADAHHLPSSIDKMRRGDALSDDDRWPWLERLQEMLRGAQATGLVLACSALKQSYRKRLQLGPGAPRFAFLELSPDELQRRLVERQGHFAGVSLLRSQLATLERPDPRCTYDGSLSPQEIAEAIRKRLSD